jgi:hypothetical protein
MVLAFFDIKGLIYTNYMTRLTTVNTKYIVDDALDGSQAVSGD